MKNNTIILGAGLTGLGAARTLPGAVVYEAKDHPGGHVYSHEFDGLHYDEGAHICHSKDKDWVKQLYANAGNVRELTQSRVSNYWHGRWVTYPVQNHLRDLPEESRINALTEIVEAQMKAHEAKPANYEEWCRAQYGEFLTENFYREYTRKYWRTPMSDMDIDWLAGRLLPSQLQRIIHGAIAPLDEKQSVFSSFHYPEQGGFFAFFKPFYDDVDVRTGFRVARVACREKTITFSNGQSVRFERCVSTMPLPDLIRAMDDVPDAIRADADSLRHTRMVVVNIVVNKPDLVPHHWFYVYDNDIDVSRVKVLSNVIDGCTPAGKTVLQTEAFRRDDEHCDADTIRDDAVLQMGRIMGYDPEKDVDSVHHIDVSHSYTVPTLGRQQAVDRIADWLQAQGIITAGLYGKWKYVWSDQAYKAGVEAGAAVGGS